MWTNSTSINALVAIEHIADLRRAAERRRPITTEPLPVVPDLRPAPAVVMRIARAEEADLVRRLAALDDAPALVGPVLLALTDDEAVAALSLRDGRVIANPFVHTTAVLALLRVRAAHLSGATPRRRPRAIRRPRFA
jgi:hypothetical protein